MELFIVTLGRIFDVELSSWYGRLSLLFCADGALCYSLMTPDKTVRYLR